MRRITAAAAATGKTVVGWHELGASTDLPAGTIGQYWNYVEPEDDHHVELVRSFVAQGGRLIMSPADVAYLDMKYPDGVEKDGRELGLQWAKGATTLDEAYGWEPTAIIDGIGDAEILGVEAPIWAETLRRIDDVEFMAFPRMAAIAEIAWSPAPEAGAGRDADDFAGRVAALGERWDVLGVAYHRVDGVPWTE
ncbi:family 20 glycosylhydrolase [Agromyces sp. MMS24-K17]|uniref:family 20 glycosylhydrolase n=1 Tax=Agromyces sp. MMS24-K17 TaxID=3372850 RepID=UPI0037553AA0